MAFIFSYGFQSLMGITHSLWDTLYKYFSPPSTLKNALLVYGQPQMLYGRHYIFLMIFL